MIRIQTTMNSLRLEPEELRVHSTIELYYLVRGGKVQFISKAQYLREPCPEIDTAAWRKRTPGSDYRGTNYYLMLIMKNGEQYLIAAGQDPFTVADVEDRVISMIDDSVIKGEKLTVIDLDQLVRECGDPPYTATKIIFGKRAEELLALRQESPQQGKILRTRYWQLCLDPCDTDVSEAAAPFLFNNEQYDGGAISAKAYELADAAGILPVFFEEDDEDSTPLRIGRDYYIRIRTGPHTYLLRTGTKEEINERCRQKINDWLAGVETLLELTDSDGDGHVPLLLSIKDTGEMLGYLCYYGVPPILP